MKRSFMTSLPDTSGAFLIASRIILRHGGNMVRASYNKAVDTHTLFLDVEGEEAALRVFELEGEYLSRVLGAAVNLLNPERIVIGGGVSLAFDLFAPSLRRALKQAVYGGANPHVEVCATPLGYDAGLYSAAAIAATQREHLCGY